MKKNPKENNYHLIVFSIFYLSLLVGFYFNEDNLGGAMNDAIIHFRITEQFNENFFKTFIDFGTKDSVLATRNSPVFWIFLSFFEKFLSYEIIRILNTGVVFLIAIILYKSLLIKFKNLNSKTLIILSTFIFISPSLRSLAIWPYSLIWGLLFFVLSIYFYLKYEQNLNFLRSSIILLTLIWASYIYPSFSVFYIFYIHKIFQKLKNKNNIIDLLALSFVFSIPAFIYIISKDFYSVYEGAQGVANLSFADSLNISNKILIISTICLYLILPVINFKEILLEVKKIKIGYFLILILVCLINFYFFNFPHDVWGGGFFHKLSNILFGNNYLFFLSSFISILIIYSVLNKKFSNYLLLILLILFNPQYTIYIKYFDPLILILFLTLFDFNLKKHFDKRKLAFYQFYGTYLFYYLVVYGKKIII